MTIRNETPYDYGRISDGERFQQYGIGLRELTARRRQVSPRLAVALEHRNKKIGTRLIQHGMKTAQQKGYASIFLVGDPKHYPWSGFRSSADGNMFNNEHIPDEYVMTCELLTDVLQGITGMIIR